MGAHRKDALPEDFQGSPGRQVNENMGQQLCVAKGTAAARMLESRVLLCVAQ